MRRSLGLALLGGQWLLVGDGDRRGGCMALTIAYRVGECVQSARLGPRRVGGVGAQDGDERRRTRRLLLLHDKGPPANGSVPQGACNSPLAGQGRDRAGTGSQPPLRGRGPVVARPVSISIYFDWLRLRMPKSHKRTLPDGGAILYVINCLSYARQNTVSSRRAGSAAGGTLAPAGR